MINDLEHSLFSAKLQNQNLKTLLQSLKESEFEKNFKILMFKIKKIENLVNLLWKNSPSIYNNDDNFFEISRFISKIKEKLTFDKKSEVQELFENIEKRFYLLKNNMNRDRMEIENKICESPNGV